MLVFIKHGAYLGKTKTTLNDKETPLMSKMDVCIKQ